MQKKKNFFLTLKFKVKISFTSSSRVNFSFHPTSYMRLVAKWKLKIRVHFSGIVVVIKMEGQPFICKTDEVGEICVHSSATGNQYWGLQGLTNNTFKVSPLQADASPLGDVEYTRSGLLGFLGPGGLVFVCGSRDGLMTVTGRKHNADDIIATVLAVEPMKFIYRGRIAVFSVRVLRDERICVVAEQRPDCSEEEVRFQIVYVACK